MVRGFNAARQNYFDLKKEKRKQKQQHAFLRNYCTVYSLTLNGDLLTTAVAEKAV